MIDPSFWDDETVASWPLVTRLTYIALWNHSDDYGHIRANPSWLHSKCFPYDNNIDMKSALLPLVETGRLALYMVKSETFGRITSFLKWQKINRPSKTGNPPINEGSPITHDCLSEDRFYQPSSGAPLPPNTHRPKSANPTVRDGEKPTDCGPISERSVSPHETLTPEVKFKLKQPLTTFEVVNVRARKEQPQPLQVIQDGVMGALEKQWEPGSEAEKLAIGWWKFYNHLGQKGKHWHHREFAPYRSQVLRVTHCVDDEHMRLAIRYAYQCTKRRFMPNGDDLYRHPATIFGRRADTFADVKQRIDTLVVEAVMWEGAQKEQRETELVTKPALTDERRDINRQKALLWLEWIEDNREGAFSLVKGTNGASDAYAAGQLKNWKDELTAASVTGEIIWDYAMHSVYTKGLSGEQIKEIEDAPQTTETTEEAEAPAHSAGV